MEHLAEASLLSPHQEIHIYKSCPNPQTFQLHAKKTCKLIAFEGTY
jgi:hypothetical protein